MTAAQAAALLNRSPVAPPPSESPTPSTRATGTEKPARRNAYTCTREDLREYREDLREYREEWETIQIINPADPRSRIIDAQRIKPTRSS